MANHVSHAALPYPVKGCRFTLLVPYRNSSGAPTDPTTPDTEISKDAGSFADCTEEVTTISGSNGMGYITLTGDETNASMVALAAKAASGPQTTLATVYPRVLAALQSGTAGAGAAGSITLASAIALDDYYIGCLVRTTGGTGGGGGSGSQNNQVRLITDFVGSTLVASVTPNWETTPDNTTTYEVLATPEWASRVSNLKVINDDVDAAIRQRLATLQAIPGQVDNTVTPTASIFQSDTAEVVKASANYWVGRLVVFTSGALIGQMRVITASVNAAGQTRFTCDSFTSAPSNDDDFLIL